MPRLPVRMKREGKGSSWRFPVLRFAREGKYGVQIPLGVWHSVDVKEPSTIFEAKDGAYVSASR